MHGHWSRLVPKIKFKVNEFTFIVQFIKRHKLEIPEELIEGTIHCKEGAAPALCERIYELLTNRKWVSARCVCVSCTVAVCMFRGCMVNFFKKMFLEHSWNLLVKHLSIWKLNYYDLSFKKKNYMICNRIELYFSLFIMISHDHATSWHCFMVKVNSNSNKFFQHLQLKKMFTSFFLTL